MPRTLQRRAGGAFALALIVSVCLAVLTLWADQTNDENLEWVAHTQEVLRVCNQVVARAYQAETSQRGYLLTGRSSYLDRYRSYIRDEEAGLERFFALTADNPSQQQRAVELRKLWQERHMRMEAVLKIRNSVGVGLQMAALMDEGMTLMDRIDGKVAEMRAEENRLLTQRRAKQQLSETLKRLAFPLGFVTNFVLLLWAYRKISDYSAARDAAEAEIRETNSELERRVQQRTSELTAANEQLSRSNQDLTRFAYVASHDLQEPLRTVGSYAGLLARRYQGQLDQKADGYIEFIISGAKRMQSMVQDLLLYSRAGTQQLSFSAVDLREIVDGARQSLNVAIAESRAEIVAESLPVLVGDAGKLTLVLQNLISNGMKFRAPDRPPRITVTGRRAGKDWFVEVSDNGIGFDPQYAERIFLIFQRLHSIGEYPGTGIGLAICKRIIEAHGGRIWAESTPGVGSHFVFSLPVSQAASAATPEEHRKELQPQNNGFVQDKSAAGRR